MPTKLKISAVKKIIDGKSSVTAIAKELGIARKTIYSWLKIYKTSPRRCKKTCLIAKYTKGKAHPREYKHTLEQKTLRLMKKEPTLSISQMAKRLNAGHHAVYNLLRALNLNTEDSRLAYCNIYAHPGIFNSEIKESVARKVINSEGRISDISRELRVSRKTIYKWLREFKKNGAVKNKYLSGFDHPRALGREVEAVVLSGVVKKPELSIHSLSKSLNYSNHAVFNILQRNFLTHKGSRIAYSQSHVPQSATQPEAIGFFDRIKSVFETFTPNLAPAPPPAESKTLPFFLTIFFSLSIFLAVFYWMSTIVGASSFGSSLGMVFAVLALAFGMFFFLYSLKYYLTTAILLSFSNRQKKDRVDLENPGMNADLSTIQIKKYPFVSVHIPFYNERNVVERSIKAATNFDYPEYEVILCDDSTDETSEKIRKYQESCLFKGEKLKETKGDGWTLTEVEVRSGVTLKHLHRTTRTGYKGGALSLALKLCDPKTEFISIFDADFVPYPDSLNFFVKYFKVANHLNEDYSKSDIAAVQGYQWHVLNKSENWITRGVRSEYAGSYVVERSGAEIYKGLKQISGSVYMIRKDVLSRIGWGTSITEDFELTLKLYNAGFKVVYTPYVQAPAECVSTLRRMIRQRMRWAEGHSFNIKKMFAKLMLSPKLTPAEKFETVYLTPYYLQAFFFLVGTFSWFLSEAVFRVRLPFWSELWGWSLILTNMVSLPLMNSVGMFLEESGERDYLGIVSFMALSYIIVPFQAYAAVKGFLEQEEGPWFRTPKTGRITDTFKRSGFYRFISGILPGKALNEDKPSHSYTLSPYLALTTANNRFDNFSIPQKKNRFIGRTVLVVVVIISLLVNNLALFVKPVKAYDSNWLYRKKLTISGTTAGAQTNFQMEIDVFSGSGTDSGKNVYCSSHCNSDFSDVRFVKSNGITDLNYWRKSYVSGTSAVFWVQVDSIPASPSTVDIYWYYGNSGATTTSNGTNTFDFFDDFSGDLSKWTIDPANTDKISISSGALRHDPDSTQSRNSYFDTRLRTTSYQITDGVIEYSVYLAGSSSNNPRIIHQMGWRVDSNDFNNGYVWRVQNSAADGGNLYFSSGAWTPFGTAFDAATGNTWHTVKVTVSGSTYTGYVDGGSGYSGTNSNKTSAGYLVSHVHGVSLDASSYVLVKDVRVRKYASPEPGYSSWGSEEQVPEMTILFIPLALAMPYLVNRLRKRKGIITIHAK